MRLCLHNFVITCHQTGLQAHTPLQLLAEKQADHTYWMLLILLFTASKHANNPLSQKGNRIALLSATNEKAASYCQNLHIQPSTQSVLNIQLWEQEEKHIYDRRGTLTPHGFQQEGKAAGVKTVLCLAGLSLRRCLRNSTDPDLLLFPCGLSFSLDVVWEVAIGTNGLAAACHVTPWEKSPLTVYMLLLRHTVARRW